VTPSFASATIREVVRSDTRPFWSGDMTDPTELRRRAEVARDLSQRARQMAMSLGDSADCARLIQYADELDVQAREMIKEADRAGGPSGVSLECQHG
jgi:hypothetical protein